MERNFRGGNRGGFRPEGGNSFAPVKVGEEMDVKIEAVGEKGDGIAKKNGFVLFVPNTKQGDDVKIRITKVLRKVGFAEVVGQGSSNQEGASEESSEGTEEGTSEAGEEEEYSEEDSENFGEEKEEEQ